MRQDGAIYDHLINRGVVLRAPIGSPVNSIAMATAVVLSIAVAKGVPLGAFDAMRPLDDPT